MSISLWDLQAFGGLPVHGSFFDEVVPSARELVQEDNQGEPFLPGSCQHLFSAFYRLAQGSNNEVSIHDWVHFWFKGPIRYPEPPQRSSKTRTSKPRLSNNPTGAVDIGFLPRTEEENAPFIELGVEESLRDEVHLAAFLSCWLCKFVLPYKKINCIRASIFKVASLMAHGEKFSLAVPVLASIYRGLREITTSPDLSSCSAIFPIHYVYGWIGEYFDTHYRANRTERSVPMYKISGEKMARSFNLPDARQLFQNDDAQNLHHFALLHDKKELRIIDNGQQSPSKTDYIISLRSSCVTLRHESDLFVESYSPHRFSRQFGFCQDAPGNLVKQPFDGTLQALLQLWDSSVHLGTSSEFVIPPFEVVPLMTREYADWWQARRVDPARKSTPIVMKALKRDHVPSSSKNGSSQRKEKLQLPAKSEAKLSDSSQAAKTSLMPETSKDTDTPCNKGKRRLRLVSKTAATTPNATSNSPKGKSPLSSTDSDDNGDQHWNHQKKKSKKLDDHHDEFPDLETISIDSDFFVDGDPSSTMPLDELAKQLGLEDISSEDMEGPLLNLNASGVAVESDDHSPDDAEVCAMDRAPLTDLGKPRKSQSSSPKSTAISQPAVASEDLVSTVQAKQPKAFKPSQWPLQLSASNFEPQKAISRLKLTYVSGVWHALCEWIKQFSVDSVENFTKLEQSIALTLKEIEDANVTDVSALKDLVEAFFRKYEEYDALRSSSSQRMTVECHQNSLSAAQQKLHDAKEENTKASGHIKTLQGKLAKVESELKVLAARRKKILAHIDEQNTMLSKSHESITTFEDEVRTIEGNPPVSEDEAEKLSKLMEEFETSRQQILSFQPFQ